MARRATTPPGDDGPVRGRTECGGGPPQPPAAGPGAGQATGKGNGDATPVLSIIVPARNEECGIAATLARVAPTAGRELIVVDGESADRTASIARRHGARVVAAPPGRGGQLNAGAERAKGALLLFLHADTLLPDDYEDQVRRVLARPGVVAGAFELRIEGREPGLRRVERLVRRRAGRRQRPYGDQALFMTAQTFRRVGGFPPWPAMEDYEMTRRLRRIGRIDLAASAVVTSGRRWRRRGIWRTTLENQLCIAAFRLGVSPERIARWRNASSWRLRDDDPAAATAVER